MYSKKCMLTYVNGPRCVKDDLSTDVGLAGGVVYSHTTCSFAFSPAPMKQGTHV